MNSLTSSKPMVCECSKVTIDLIMIPSGGMNKACFQVIRHSQHCLMAKHLTQNLKHPFTEVKGVGKSCQSRIYLCIWNTIGKYRLFQSLSENKINWTQKQYKTVNVFRKGTRAGKEKSTRACTYTIWTGLRI